jgi:NMD protein affecting ribosome stability and mRNA decay
MKCPKCNVEMTSTSNPNDTIATYICTCGLEVRDKRVDVAKSLIEATYTELLTELQARSSDIVEIIPNPISAQIIAADKASKHYGETLSIIVIMRDEPVLMAARR